MIRRIRLLSSFAFLRLRLRLCALLFTLLSWQDDIVLVFSFPMAYSLPFASQPASQPLLAASQPASQPASEPASQAE